MYSTSRLLPPPMRLIAALLLAFGTLAAGSASPAAPAATINVTTTAESPGGSGDCTLGEAIQAANTDSPVDACAAGSGVDTIVLPAGTYTLTTPISLTVGSTAFVVSTTISIQGNGATLVRGGPSTNRLRFFYVNAAAHLTLSNLTLKNGLAQGNSGGTGADGLPAGGGALYNDGLVTLDATSFISNTAQGGAGGSATGNSAGGNGGKGDGGAIYNAGGLQFIASPSTFQGNSAFGGSGGAGGSPGTTQAGNGGEGANADGGALYNAGVVTATETSLTFSRNSAFGGLGGLGGFGIPAGNGGPGAAGEGGAIHNVGKLWIAVSGSQISGNLAQGGNGGFGVLAAPGVSGSGLGGGLNNIGLGVAVLDGLAVEDNSALGAAFALGPPGLGAGGGIYSENSLTLTHSSLISNTARGSDGSGSAPGNSLGGGLFGLTRLALADDLITRNTAVRASGPAVPTVSGGGLYLTDLAAATVARTAIVSNTATLSSTSQGGGAAVFNSFSVDFSNATFSGNQADSGAGLYVAVAAHMTVTHASLISNVATLAGQGLWFGLGSLTLRNSLLAGNSSANCTGSISDGGGNLDSANSCGFTLTTSLIDTAPLMGPLADNGGNTLTHALLPGSPAIDKALDAYCLSTDQRGMARPVGVHCDIGAFESGFKLTLPLVRK